LFAEIPLDDVSTSMTINAPAALLLLLYELVAEEQGLPPTSLRGTVQNDILKEYVARGNYIFPPRPSMRITTDLFAYCAERIPRDRFGATKPRALALRFHAQTGGSTLTAQQPESNVVRVAVQALSAVCGGAQSIHTNAFDEALALPTERSARIALRTQQILAAEAGGTDTADPLGGAYFIQALTRELEEQAWELIERVDDLGGAAEAG